MKLLAGIAFVVGSLAPILYAVDTLSRMRNKQVYPLIRLQGADGQLFTLEVEGTSWLRQRRAKTCAQTQDAGSTARRIA